MPSLCQDRDRTRGREGCTNQPSSLISCPTPTHLCCSQFLTNVLFLCLNGIKTICSDYFFGSPVCTKLNFSPVNPSYVNLIISQAREPGREEGGSVPTHPSLWVLRKLGLTGVLASSRTALAVRCTVIPRAERSVLINRPSAVEFLRVWAAECFLD